MKFYKIVVTGVFNAGKTTFIKTLSDIDIVNTDQTTSRQNEIEIKSATTVALDYGRVKLGDNVIAHLFGTPGQNRFDFMHDILSQGMDGFIVLIDSTDGETLNEVAGLTTIFKAFGNIPYLLVANKSDLKGLEDSEIRRRLKLADNQPLVPAVATDKVSARAVVERLITMIEEKS